MDWDEGVAGNDPLQGLPSEEFLLHLREAEMLELGGEIVFQHGCCGVGFEQRAEEPSPSHTAELELAPSADS